MQSTVTLCLRSNVYTRLHRVLQPFLLLRPQPQPQLLTEPPQVTGLTPRQQYLKGFQWIPLEHKHRTCVTTVSRKVTSLQRQDPAGRCSLAWTHASTAERSNQRVATWDNSVPRTPLQGEDRPECNPQRSSLKLPLPQRLQQQQQGSLLLKMTWRVSRMDKI